MTDRDKEILVSYKRGISINEIARKNKLKYGYTSDYIDKLILFEKMIFKKNKEIENENKGHIGGRCFCLHTNNPAVLAAYEKINKTYIY